MAEGRELSKHDDDLVALLVEVEHGGKKLGDIVRFDHSKKLWHIWDGRRWAADKTDLVYDMVRECSVNLLREASGSDAKAIVTLLDRGKKESFLKTLASRRGIAMAGDEWNPDPELMAFTNGVLNLRTLEFDTEPDPGLLLSYSTGHPWEPKAGPEEFATFVDEIMGGDAELTDYLIRMLGYAMIGWQREQKFWMWVGQGQNGKGTLAKVVAHALGDYADTPSAELYMKTRFGAARADAARPELLRLQGVRFVWMSEPSGGQFHEEMLKAHTGDDPIQARDLYGKASSYTTFRPTHTINFLTNNPPRTEDVGASMQRRVRVIKFEQDFRGAKEDKGLEERLRKPDAIAGALRLMAFAASRYFEDGLPEPARILEWSQEYIEENDPLTAFIQEACKTGDGISSNAAAMWGAYEDWCAKKDVEPGSRMSFGLSLSRRFKKVRRGEGNIYLRIKPKSAIDLADEGDEE